MNRARHLLLAAAGVILLASPAVQAMDARAAETLVRKSGCLRCHSLGDKRKEQEVPTYGEVARKHKGESGIEDKLVARAIQGDKVKIAGKEEEHGRFKTDDKDQVRNAIRWILSLGG